jgi:hypothetical protein
MRIRRAILPAILALGVAGSVWAMPAAAAHAPGARVQVVALSATSTHYHN